MAETKKEIIQENEQLKATVYNLRLYLTEALRMAPYLRLRLGKMFDGMPGYVAEKPKE